MNHNKELCLVLGGGGFIGKRLVNELIGEGRFSVRVFDRYQDTEAAHQDLYGGSSDVEVMAGDFFNRTDLQAALKDVSYVFHLVSTTTPISSANDPFIDIETNVKGSIELMELCSQTPSVKRFVFFSSGGTVYGDQPNEELSEDLPAQPFSPYGIGKITIENYLRYYKRTHGLDSVIYRVANPYGEGQNLAAKQGIIPIFLGHALNNEPVTVFGDGTMIRDYLYVGDACKLIVNTFSRPELQHEVYNLGSGGGRTVNEVVAAIEQSTGVKLEVEHIPQPSAFVQKVVLDMSRFTDEFNMSPTTSLEDGIKQTWSHIQNDRERT
jgi:UDP-glucose 4-epimerase